MMALLVSVSHSRMVAAWEAQTDSQMWQNVNSAVKVGDVKGTKEALYKLLTVSCACHGYYNKILYISDRSWRNKVACVTVPFTYVISSLNLY